MSTQDDTRLQVAMDLLQELGDLLSAIRGQQLEDSKQHGGSHELQAQIADLQKELCLSRDAHQVTTLELEAARAEVTRLNQWVGNASLGEDLINNTNDAGKPGAHHRAISSERLEHALRDLGRGDEPPLDWQRRVTDEIARRHESPWHRRFWSWLRGRR